VAVEVPSLGGLFLYPFAHLSLLDLHGRVRVDVSPRGGPVHIESNSARVSGWRGWVALFGFFLGLCSLFALVVTIGEGWYEYSQSRWVETTAQIHECRLETREGDRESPVSIECRIGFRAGGEDIVTKVSSRSARPGQDGLMQDWLEAHPDGSSITARYNPENTRKVVLVTPGRPPVGAADTDEPSSAGPFCCGLSAHAGDRKSSTEVMLATVQPH
jgi:hypothetical protein